MTGDFNNDGLPDFALADGVSLVTLLQQVDGSYQTVSSQPAFPPTYYGPASPAVPATLIAGDFNGDGKTDLAGSRAIRSPCFKAWVTALTALSTGPSYPGHQVCRKAISTAMASRTW